MKANKPIRFVGYFDHHFCGPDPELVVRLGPDSVNIVVGGFVLVLDPENAGRLADAIATAASLTAEKELPPTLDPEKREGGDA